VRDYIRAQVLRRWIVDPEDIRGKNWTVTIHIVLMPDGSVRTAEVVQTPHSPTSKAYLYFALSARNAVLLSSPLAIPAGAYDIARDISIEFDPREVLQ
jgi:hypothetical protein